MSFYILDGEGNGNTAGVDSKKRVKSFATSISGSAEAAQNGDLYNINTGTITLTSGDPSALLYIKNTDSVPFVITRVFYNIGNSTGGSGDMAIDIYKKVTAGTIVSSGTDLAAEDLNFASAQELQATVKKGAEGLNVTDGRVAVSSLFAAAGQRALITFDTIVLDPGTTLAIVVTPQAGNGSMDIQVGCNAYRFTD